MPNISDVTDVLSFFTFVGDLFSYFFDVIKNIWNFIVSLFNPAYYTDIFSSLPSPFNTILITLISFVCMLLIFRLCERIVSVIRP